MKRILTFLLWAFIILAIDIACFVCSSYICDYFLSRKDIDVLNVEYFQIPANDSADTDDDTVFLKVVSGKNKSLFMVSQSFQYLRNATNFDYIDKNNVIIREVYNNTNSLEIADERLKISLDCHKASSEWAIFSYCNSKKIRLQPLFDTFEYKSYGDL